MLMELQAPASKDEDVVWGVAYRIEESREDEVRAYLGSDPIPYSTTSAAHLLRTE